MAWVKLDEHFADHPKMAEACDSSAGPLPQLLWALGLAYANRKLTDGFLSIPVVRRLINWGGSKVTVEGRPPENEFLADQLVRAGLWVAVEEEDELGGIIVHGYRIHDYHDHQPRAAEVLAKREARAAAGRSSGEVRRNKTGTNDEQNANKSGTKTNTGTGTVTQEEISFAQPGVERESQTGQQSAPSETPADDGLGAAAKFDFEALYALYPRKVGKKRGLQRCRSQITSQRRYDQLHTAITNYAATMAREGRELSYIKHFDSFMSIWEDWINPEQQQQQNLGADLARRIAERERRERGEA